jgi:glycolate oxidase
MSYKTMDAKDFAYLRKLIGDDERVLTQESMNEEYSHDELSGTTRFPDIVIKALSTEEVSAIMKYATVQNIPVTPRGAGTGLVGASVAMENGI